MANGEPCGGLEQMALPEEREFLRAVINSVIEGIVAIDEETLVVLFNPAAERIFGYSAAEVLGRSVSILMPEPHRSAHESYVRTFMRTGEAKVIGFGQELTGQRKDGSLFPMYLSVSALYVGGKRRFVGVVRDITEQKQAEDQLRKLSLAVEQSPAAVVITDVDGRIEYVNPKFVRVTGYAPEEVKGQNPRMLKSGEMEPEDYRGLWETIRAGREWRGLFHNKKKNGELYWESASISPIKNARGVITHFVAVKEDISAQKEAEEALQEAKRVADEANQAKSEFLACMSHEIRTPMNAIIGMAELLAETPLNAQQRRYVDIFRSAGETLLGIIDDILDLSKIEAGRIGLESISFDLVDLVETTCEVMAIRAHEKGLELACHVEPRTPARVSGDPARLRQVLTNLLGNAIKFTEHGEVVLRVAPSGAASEGELEFAVVDTGIGIPADKIATIFRRFTQADASTTRRFGGTGLGLTISRRLVQLMGGRFTVESREGEGSTFSFTVPLATAAAGQGKLGDREPDLHGVRVLVVDDNATNRLILQDMLTRRGALVSEAADGPECLKSLERAQREGTFFDVLLLDGRMPGMDGFGVAERIRREPALANVAIMMLTSDSRAGDIKRSQDLGMTGYLMKPVKRAELLRALGTALQQSPRHHEPAKERAPADLSSLVTRPLNVLLVEDSPDNRFLIEAYLRQTPIRLEMAENGREGLRKFREGVFDLVLMDMEMPVMDGYAATQAIRALERETRRRPVPIIALTAYVLVEEVKKGLDAGCTAHLAKPIKKATLLEMIVRHTVTDYPVGSGEATDSGIGLDAAESPPDAESRIVIKVDADLEELIPGFLENRRAELKQMKEALDAWDFEKLRQLGHTLKGVGGGYGFQDLSEMGRRLEEAAKSRDSEGAAAVVEDLGRYLALVDVMYEEI